MMFKPFNSAAVISWIEELLTERFGAEFNLSVAENEDVFINISGHKGCIVLKKTDFHFDDISENIPNVLWNAAGEGWAPVIGYSLFAPGVDNLRTPLIEESSSGHVIYYNFLALMYWAMTRQEEIRSHVRDRFNRFSAKNSHAYLNGYLTRPIVDEWLEILQQVMQKQWPLLEIRKKSYSVRVSHDVDQPSRYGFLTFFGLLKSIAKDLIRNRKLSSCFIAPYVRLTTRRKISTLDPSNTFNWIMAASEKRGLISAFYFMTGCERGKLDGDYDLSHPAIINLLNEINSRGHEIGLHPGFASSNKKGLLEHEARYLKKICNDAGISQETWGGRMHYLRWEMPSTMQAWERANMDYDSTLGYADHPGFRSSTCHEYHAFDPVKGERLSLIIRPLVAMECTVTGKRYLGLGFGQQAFELFGCLIDNCKSVNGIFTFLWHNSNFDSQAERFLYEKVLDYAVESE